MSAVLGDLSKILVCPVCKSEVTIEGSQVTCLNRVHNHEFPVVDGIPVMLPESSLSIKDFELTQKKWNEEYRGRYSLDSIRLDDPELKDAYYHIKKYLKKTNGLFLEAGCGPSRLSLLLAKEGINTVGIDFSLNGLFLARKLFRQAGAKGTFVCGDIVKMPFRDNIFSFVYTGGVLEHLRDMPGAVKEIYRCLTPGGFTTNTVPHISLVTPYRIMQWGNIPDIPVIRNIIEFSEIAVLKGKRMRFGYEKSFTSTQMRGVFGKAGFKNLQSGLFETYYPLEVIPSIGLKKLVSRFVNSSGVFWPMIYVNGEKL